MTPEAPDPRQHTIHTFCCGGCCIRACCLEYGGREFESRSLHLQPETKLREERGLSGRRKGLKTVPLAQALLSLKPAKTKQQHFLLIYSSHLQVSDIEIESVFRRVGGAPSGWMVFRRLPTPFVANPDAIWKKRTKKIKLKVSLHRTFEIFFAMNYPKVKPWIATDRNI